MTRLLNDLDNDEEPVVVCTIRGSLLISVKIVHISVVKHFHARDKSFRVDYDPHRLHWTEVIGISAKFSGDL